VATLISIIAVNLTRGTSGWLAAVLAVLLSLALRAFYRRWLGGVTGDLIGAAGEIVETAVLLAVAN
jgi:cobalamin synthase